MTTPPPDGFAVDRRHPDEVDRPGGPGWNDGTDRAEEDTRVNGAQWSPGDPAPWHSGWSSAQPPRPRRRPLAVALAALAVLLGVAALGVPYGLLWARLAPDPELFKVTGGFYPENGLYPVDSQPEQFVAGDGWFVLLGVAFGGLAALAVWIVLRRWRGPVLLAALTVGAIAGGVLAWWIGHRLGLAAFDQAVAQAPEGAHLRQPSDVQITGLGTWWGVIPQVRGVLLAEAFGAVVAYTLLAGWSRHPGLRPAAEPTAALAPWETTWPVSSGSAAPPAQTAAPAPPGPDQATPPRA